MTLYFSDISSDTRDFLAAKTLDAVKRFAQTEEGKKALNEINKNYKETKK